MPSLKNQFGENNVNNTIDASALANSIAEQCKQFEQSPEYAEMINKAVTKLYTSAIDDVFRWGDFPDRVKAAIKGAMPENVGDFVDLAKYNHLAMSALKSSWESSGIETSLIRQIQNASHETLAGLKVPEFILMSDLFEAFIDDNADSAAENNWEKPNVLIKERDSVMLKEYWEIGFEADEERTSSFSSSKTYGFQFENCLNIRAIYEDRRDKTIKMYGEYKCYELYAGKVDGDILGKQIIKPYGKFEQLMCALYYGSACLVWDDCDPESLYYPHHD